MEIALLLMMLWLVCDVTTRIQEHRVIGGTAATLGQFPYFAQFIIARGEGGLNATGCGASLLSPQWILTAAHCVKGSEKELKQIVEREWNWVVMNSTRDGQIYPPADVNKASEFHRHPGHCDEYNEEGGLKRVDNDVALVKLKRRYETSKTVKTVYLPPLGKTSRCRTGLIMGLGQMLDANGELAKNITLQYAKVKSLKHENLVTQVNESVVKTVFYTEVYWGEGHSMRGDSGGPFICKNGLWKVSVVYGIDSHAWDSGDFKLTVYEDVEKHMEFILKYVTDAKIYGGRKHTRVVKDDDNTTPAGLGSVTSSSFIIFVCVALVL